VWLWISVWIAAVDVVCVMFGLGLMVDGWWNRTRSRISHTEANVYPKFVTI
jgi:hypothetical protein